jgi:thioredoxin 2
MATLASDSSGIIASCPNCGKKNRIPFARVASPAQCGNCHTDLPPPGRPVDISETSAFDRLIAESPLPVVVDFWAEWCGPCRMVAPELEKVARQEAGKLIVAKVNTETVPALAARFAVRSIPMMAVFAGGREVDRTMGSRPAAAIVQFVQQAVVKAPAR